MAGLQRRRFAAQLILLLALAGSVAARRRRLLQDTSVLTFGVSVGSGPDALVRRAYVAQDAAANALYSIAQVEQGTVALGGSSLSVRQAEGRPVQSTFVYRLQPGSISQAQWAVNLQERATSQQSFLVTAAAASPLTGNLVLAGTYSGVLALGNAANLTSEGSFDIFVAAVSAADGSVLWAASFGGAVGPDAAFDLGFNPLTGDVLVSGAFSKNAVFGPDHAASASVNNVLQAEGAFVASLTAAEGAVNWVSSFPVDAEFLSTVKLAATAEGLFLGAAAAGPFTLYAGAAKLSIAASGAGAVLLKLGLDGQLDAGTPPATIVAVSNGDPAFSLSGLAATQGALYASCTYVGRLLVGSSTVGATAGGDSYSDAAVLQLSAALQPVWFTTLSGAGAQTTTSLAAVPGNASVFVSGNAWSPNEVVVTSATTAGMVSNSSFQAPPASLKGAFVMQLSGSTGQELWLRTFEGYQDQGSEILYDAHGPGDAQLLVTGLFDRGRGCLALNSRGAQCASGARPFFLAAIPVSPTNTAAAEDELERNNPASKANASSSSGGLSAGAIAGIVIGSLLGAALLAAAGVYLYKRWRQRREAQAASSEGVSSGAPSGVMYTSNPSWSPDGPPAGTATVTITTGALDKK